MKRVMLARVMQSLVLVLALLAVAPAIIICFCGFIPALIYMQLLIIWIQTELLMRQLFLYKSQFISVLTLGALNGALHIHNC